MIHKIWRPNSRNDLWIETVCGIRYEAAHVTKKEVEIDFEHPYIKRPNAQGKCVNCFGPIDGVLPSS